MTGPSAIDVPGLMPTGATWSQATVCGGLVFVSGQVAWDADGNVVGDSVAAQSEVVWDNIERALEAAGSRLDLLARVTVYLTSTDGIADFRAVREKRLAGIRPASTLVVVAALADPALLVEVDAVAGLAA
jgi:enamine deaminase RidA (YjgF/YER057c/UK114 family)